MTHGDPTDPVMTEDPGFRLVRGGRWWSQDKTVWLGLTMQITDTQSGEKKICLKIACSTTYRYNRVRPPVFES